MKIRRKLPKVSRTARPLYVIGYPDAPPAQAELQSWFDLEYGGPLRLKEGPRPGSSGATPAPLVATHGPWDAAIMMVLPPSEAGAWKDQLGWSHPLAGCVFPTTGTPGKAPDLVLHAARLARGLALLTDGTAYDLVTGSYLNPSDWTDRPLSQFLAVDHITVSHTESPDPERDWFYTKGLSKFGLDDLETFRPKGLPGRPVLDSLAGIAEALLLSGRSPNVGASVPLPALGVTVNVLNHRTASPSDPPFILREISWQHIDKM